MSCTNGETQFSRTGFGRAIQRAFPVATAANLAAITGQSLRAAQLQVAGEADPSAEALAACLAALGPGFLAEIVPAARWARGFARAEAIETAWRQLDAAMNEGGVAAKGSDRAKPSDPHSADRPQLPLAAVG